MEIRRWFFPPNKPATISTISSSDNLTLPRNRSGDTNASGVVDHLRMLLNVASGGVVFWLASEEEVHAGKEKGGKA